MSGSSATGHLDAAQSIGRRLVDEAVWWEDRCTWLGDSVEQTDGGWEVVHRSLGADLYDGSAGVGWFLAQLFGTRGDDAVRRTAEGALRNALARASADPVSGGLYHGALGVAVAAVEAGRLLGSSGLLAAGQDLGRGIADDVAAADDRTGDFDLVGGMAGSVVGLLALASREHDPEFVAAARAAGDRLIDGAVHRDAGWCWPSPEAELAGAAPLCGLAHGAAGVAWAFAELFETTGDDRYLEAAVMACRYERGWYAGGRGWPDLRPPESGEPETTGWPTHPAYWCHGAVGIGLQRLRLFEITGDRVAGAEAGAALAAARMAGRTALRGPSTSFDANLSICHGLSGIADLEAEAAVVLGVREHLDAARALGDAGMKRSAAAGGRLPCGVPGGGETAGLMLGLAGIGALHLRLHDPAAVPPPGLIARPRNPRPGSERRADVEARVRAYA